MTSSEEQRLHYSQTSFEIKSEKQSYRTVAFIETHIESEDEEKVSS